MAVTIRKIRCNLTGDEYQWKAEYIKKRIEYYGSVELFARYFIKQKFVEHIARGNSIEEIAKMEGFKYDPTQKLYYEELVAFHKELISKRNTSTGVESKTTFAETDEDVAEFLTNWFAFRSA